MTHYTPTMTAEQQARDLLERIGVEDAQSFSAGELVELANLIVDAERYRWMRKAGAWESEIGMETLSESPNNFDNAVDAAMGLPWKPEIQRHHCFRRNRLD